MSHNIFGLDFDFKSSFNPYLIKLNKTSLLSRLHIESGPNSNQPSAASSASRKIAQLNRELFERGRKVNDNDDYKHRLQRQMARRAENIRYLELEARDQEACGHAELDWEALTIKQRLKDEQNETERIIEDIDTENETLNREIDQLQQKLESLLYNDDDD